MILTDKCLIAFNKWSENKGIKNLNVKEYSLDVAKAIHYGIMVLFFDSVGFKIFMDGVADDYYFVIKENHSDKTSTKKHFQSDESKTRNDSLESAIRKANQLYNAKI